MQTEVKNEKEYKPAKSVIRYAWVRMKEEGAVKLTDKKKIFTEVLEESSIQPWTKQYMIKKANSMRSHTAFDRYLINSKSYFERNFVMVEEKDR